MAVTPAAAGSADAAVQLTTLAGWRQFVAEVPSIPGLLAEQDWFSLEDGKRAAMTRSAWGTTPGWSWSRPRSLGGWSSVAGTGPRAERPRPGSPRLRSRP
jgi:hypothetical protein